MRQKAQWDREVLYREEETADEPSISHSFVLPPLTAEPFLWQPMIPARVPQPSRVRSRNVPLLIESGWHWQLCDTSL